MKKGRLIAFFLFVLLIGTGLGYFTKPAANNITLGLDLQGGFEVLYDVQPVKKGDKITKDVLVSTVEALNRRANVLGVSEPNIQIEGNNRIRVQLAGVTNQNRAREILATEAQLSFRDANDKELLNGADLVENGAKQTYDSTTNEPIVTIKLKDADKFGEVTKKVMNMAPNNQLVIWLDYEKGDSFKKEVQKEHPKYVSAPNVSQELNTTDVKIEGHFTAQEAKDLASILNAGALPVKLTEKYSTSVGAQFGQQALHETVFAGIVGIAIIFLFMLFYYRLPGFIAVITLSVYIYITLQVFDWMNAVLTLPGIAALILGVGMAVDANIITYERIKEELKLGKSVRSAFRSGNRRSFATILDANVTTIIAAVVLFIFGTSSVKGFATMLILSILTSFITAVFLSRFLLALLVESRWLDRKKGWFGVNKKHIMNIQDTDENTEPHTPFQKWDFTSKRKYFFIISSAITIAGIIILLVFKLNLGIDFASGARIEVQSDHKLTTEQVEKDFESLGMDPDTIVLSGEKKNIGVARFVGVPDKETIAKVKTHFKDKYGTEPNVSTVSPTVGKELARNALYALAIASIGIIIYVSIRFEYRMAIAAIASLLYDAFFIVTVFSITRLEVDVTFIAAILTIIGYSINDTIVTFDRIREHMKKRKPKTFADLNHIVNLSLQQTFTRSINTVLTVVIVVVTLLIFGASSITNFSVALLVGLLTGVYSSLYIAAQIWLVWKGKELKKDSVQ
ncbi:MULTISPECIES: protein translocase subunit SecDF [Bacillus]|jgi:SecD/SecF fusion protein|uniref:Multifunctional fusion protein n=1 Tax=Bacillus spizizenii (strain DSM 15029 / JCM 12233 / NBRC 101239 / NRRL B-23049 / TU-B-10) TaxID=1052585 RepID=G4NYA0_BACS4|nr:protein translocase subunit SecDF [Bacillus spizizenii]APH69413.1 protein translocase subunit SecDF [Bacillus subtilis]AEP87609.1 SecDF protein [Bacillus spizizenii TU-B-10]MBK4203849.1 protein translocase subunit SecDF [Bacillus subtilis]MEC1436829.1 protein translocase subunit SecDF [Bacillus spizizenii]OPG92921.1 protein translocase subunit SecDF [Bacillus spizizenii]